MCKQCKVVGMSRIERDNEIAIQRRTLTLERRRYVASPTGWTDARAAVANLGDPANDCARAERERERIREADAELIGRSEWWPDQVSATAPTL